MTLEEAYMTREQRLASLASFIATKIMSEAPTQKADVAQLVVTLLFGPLTRIKFHDE